VYNTDCPFVPTTNSTPGLAPFVATVFSSAIPGLIRATTAVSLDVTGDPTGGVPTAFAVFVRLAEIVRDAVTVTACPAASVPTFAA
jgi:hypothetical protein